MKPVMVTGAAGFIGAHLVRRLAATGREVRALDARPAAGLDRAPSIQFNRLDVRDTHALKTMLQGVDTMYHLASAHLQVNAPASLFEEINVRAAVGVVEACASAGVRRLVHTSSVGIYGHVQRPPAGEDAPRAPRNTYERSKLAGEEAVVRTASTLGVDVIVLRPAWVYGIGCSRTAKLIRSLRRHRFLYIGDGSNLRHPLYIDDLLDAFEQASRAPASLAGRVYNVAGPRALPMRELVGTCARVLGVAEPRHRIPRLGGLALARCTELLFGISGREPPFSRRSLTFFESDNSFDTSAAKRDLGFEARFDLEEGLRRTLDAEPSHAAA